MSVFVRMMLSVGILLVAVACSDDGRRDPGDHNGREEHPVSPVLPDGTRLTAQDIAELEDATPRCVGAGVSLCYGVPGVLVVADDESVSLRDLAADGRSARFSLKARSIELDGEIAGYDAVKIGENDDVQWWRASTGLDSVIYFVISNN